MQLEQVVTEITNDRYVALALPLFFFAVTLEALISARQMRKLYALKDFIMSMMMLVFSSLVDLLPKLFAFITFAYLHEISPLRDLVQRQWWVWVLLFFLDDFIYYWFHRANHEVRLLWAGHVPHHSSEKLNFGTALRQGVGERLHKYFFWIPLPLLGFDPLMIFTAISLNLIYQFWVHTELVKKLPGIFEFFFNTPSHHRVHHGSNVIYLDRNHGGVLIIWDRIFGTFSEEISSVPVEYGLTNNVKTYNPAALAAGEYIDIWRDIKAADRLRDKFLYLFLAPGWHHKKDDLRSNTLRASI